MKKLFATALVFAVLLSVMPSVIAQETNGVSTEVSAADIQEARPVDKCINEAIAKKPALRPAAAKALCAKRIAEIKYQKAKTAYKNVKEAFTARKASFDTAKQAFNQKKSECTLASGEEKTACIETLKAKSAEALINQAEAIIAQLQKLQDKNIAVEGAEESIATLQEAIESLQDDNSSKETIIAAAKTIRDEWLKIKVAAKKKLGSSLLAKFTALFAKAKNIEDKLAERITALKGKGYDTSKLETALAKFKEDLANAKTKWEAAKAKFSEANTAKDIDVLMKEVNAFMKNAKAYLQHGFVAVKKLIAATIKAGTGAAVSEAETAVEPLAETELVPETTGTAAEETQPTETTSEATTDQNSSA
ncbi:hypothetical protein HZB89_00810 [archaeon]|nr:hypothetical protein [archaeon]